MRLAIDVCKKSRFLFWNRHFSSKISQFIYLINFNSKLEKKISKNAVHIDKILSDIKICDPAIGSGAFPVELMNQTVNLRKKLDRFIDNQKRSSYTFKRNFIEKSLYGNDIDQTTNPIEAGLGWITALYKSHNLWN